jgi:hypothetical protein
MKPALHRVLEKKQMIDRFRGLAAEGNFAFTF